MDRRRFLSTTVAGILAAPVGAEAQLSSDVRRIGLLSPFSPADAASWHESFRLGLEALGWVEGKNITIEYRYADGRNNLLPDLAADLVRLNVDVLVTSVTTDTVPATKATATIPIVMASAGDPVAAGIVENLARPGGNVTGLTSMAPDLPKQRLALLREIRPRLSRVAVLWNPDNQISGLSWQEMQAPAQKLAVQLLSVQARTANEFEGALEEAARGTADALIIMPDPVVVRNFRSIADLAVKYRLPSMFHLREWPASGGLIAYGPDRLDLFRRASTYVDKILRGAKPADLPIEQPTKFDLVVNLKTAKALSLTIPPSLLLRADQVIE